MPCQNYHQTKSADVKGKEQKGLRIDLGEARGVTTLMEHAPMLLLMFYSLFCMLMASHSSSLDTITPSRPLRENETIVSAGGTFELGFFTNHYDFLYLGIWYKNQTEASTKTVVWVANTEESLYVSETNSSVLRLTDQGILVLLGGQGTTTIWSSNYSSRSTKNPAVARLLESGNLVIKDANDDDTDTQNFLWQSFDYPCDTLLPGMKLGKNKKTGLDRYLSSGRYSYQLDPRGYAQLFLLMIVSLDQEQVPYLRVGPWDGLGINWKRSLDGEFLPDSNCESRFVYDDEKRMSFSYGFFNCSKLTRLVLNGAGFLERWVWLGYDWILYNTAPMDSCDTYASCGAYSICYPDTSSFSDHNTKKCRCLEGFVPKLVKDSGNSDWDWSEGCVRRRPLLDCNSKLVGGGGGGDVLVKYSGLNLPDSHYSWFNKSMKLEECDTLCLKNCSCTAYANLDLSGSGGGGGSGCLLLFGDLLDIRNSSSPSDQHFYIRMAASKPDKTSLGPNKRKTIEVSLLAASTGAIVLLGLLGMCFYISKKWQPKRQERKEHHKQNEDDVQLQLFDLATITIATNNFSIDNKLGEGGFGPVYKGML